MMTEKTKIKLAPVQETLLIPLLGRAEETKKKNGLVSDPKALEIVDSLDYDFSKWKNTASLFGSCIRSRMFDEQVNQFFSLHPSGTVVEIGAGLNTRYERLDNGQAQWLEIDLADSMALRRKFFKDTARRTMLAASVLDKEWIEQLEALPGPYCFISEAVLIYLNSRDVEKVLRDLAKKFPGAWLVMDTASSKMVESQAKHDAMKQMSKESWFKWKCDDPESIEPWGLTLAQSQTFLDAPGDLRPAMPFSYRFMMACFPWLLRRMTRGYRINQYQFAGIPGS